MRAKTDIYVDCWSELANQLLPVCQGTFWQLDHEKLRPGSVYVLGRNEFERCRDLILANLTHCHFVFSNPAEGATTMLGQMQRYGITDLVNHGSIGMIAGADVPHVPRIFVYENFLEKIINMPGNLQQSQMQPGTTQHHRWDFLFLNGRCRAHRRFLLLNLQDQGLLERSLYTCLEAVPAGKTFGTHDSDPYVFSLSDQLQRTLLKNGLPIKLLPPEYEVPRYQSNVMLSQQHRDRFWPNARPPRDIKSRLFEYRGQWEWGESYVYHRPYHDSAFSLVSETVFQGNKSFRTEKIWKPIMMRHPWVAAANVGFYQDMRRLGFKTFDTLIDESFDSETDHQRRMQGVIDTVKMICQTGATDFQNAARHICEHNYQRMLDLSQEITTEFPSQFCRWVDQNFTGIGHE